jgi:hypothetical protein
MLRKHTEEALALDTGIEYLDGLYGYALVLTRNHAEAEDLVRKPIFEPLLPWRDCERAAI